MFYLLLAIASSAMVSIGMRLSAGRAGERGKLVANYGVCLALALVHMGPLPQRGAPGDMGFAAAMGLVNGALYLLGFVLLQNSQRKNGVVLSAAFMKLGLLIPVAASACLFGEYPSPLQGIGFLLSLGAILLIHTEKGQGAASHKAGLFLLLLVSGVSDTMSKLFEAFGESALDDLFLVLTFAAALLLSFALLQSKKERLCRADFLYGLWIGVPNYFSARFLLKSLASLSAVVVYPTYSAGTIAAIAFAGMLFFGERPGRREWAAIGMILAALALLNL